jgi:hypothetical protein
MKRGAIALTFMAIIAFGLVTIVLGNYLIRQGTNPYTGTEQVIYFSNPELENIIILLTPDEGVKVDLSVWSAAGLQFNNRIAETKPMSEGIFISYKNKDNTVGGYIALSKQNPAIVPLQKGVTTTIKKNKCTDIFYGAKTLLKECK